MVKDWTSFLKSEQCFSQTSEIFNLWVQNESDNRWSWRGNNKTSLENVVVLEVMATDLCSLPLFFLSHFKIQRNFCTHGKRLVPVRLCSNLIKMQKCSVQSNSVLFVSRQFIIIVTSRRLILQGKGPTILKRMNELEKCWHILSLSSFKMDWGEMGNRALVWWVKFRKSWRSRRWRCYPACYWCSAHKQSHLTAWRTISVQGTTVLHHLFCKCLGAEESKCFPTVAAGFQLLCTLLYYSFCNAPNVFFSEWQVWNAGRPVSGILYDRKTKNPEY